MCVLAVALLGAIATARAADWEWDGLQLFWENDLLTLGNRDRAYTNGLRAAVLFRPEGEPGAGPLAPLEKAARSWCTFLPTVYGFGDDSCSVRSGFAIGQLMYTPFDITNRAFQPNDQPWMGWLYFGGLLQFHAHKTSNSKDERKPADVVSMLEVDVGPVGRRSYAKEVQRWAHLDLGFSGREPAGWANQLGSRLGWRVSYLTAGRWHGPQSTLDYDLLPHFGVAVGNVRTSLNAGATVRLGYGMDDVPVGGIETIPAIGDRGKNKKGSVYVFARADMRWIGRSMAIDDNEQRDRLNIVKRRWVDTLSAGFSLGWDEFRLTYASNRRAPEFKYRDGVVPGRHNFGMLAIEWQKAL